MTGKARRAAVVLAAGKGTRMKSDKAKVLHPLGGRPMLSYPVRAALEAGCAPVVVVVGHQAESVKAELAKDLPGAPLSFALQSEQLGTGHAVRMAVDALKAAGLGAGDQVLLLAGDVPLLTGATLQRLAEAQGAWKLALVTCLAREPHGYGRVLRGLEGGVLRIVEHKDASEFERQVKEINASIYAVEAGFLYEALEKLSPKNAQGEYYLTDIVAQAAHVGGRVEAIVVDEAEVAGVNDREQLAAADAVRRQRKLSAMMRAGVTVIDPQSTFVDDAVEVEADATLEPMVSLRGKTRVAQGASIGQGAVVINCTIGANAKVLPYSHFDESEMKERTTAGPFARLRPGSVMLPDSHIGNYVELKNTTLGAGSKSNHLAYLGDATIGAGVNLGAGTITCNYDGVNKHRTIIEDGVFVGSDSQIVAPITLGKGSYVGTGTTIREDVPPGALAVSAGKQRNLEGWVERKAPKKKAKE
ncbi:MAG: bifunctional UDP-N-acetylglucosamine diphosphorylase/glucosamine-1-phosphate N-acetyltransferase GlmU [Deltaproteobacteria bacterium]|nr:bifunctional UDP-N-acetylglucosamine diphosphorylase/glucosamine-1-phosphate N-acetyltransferase GlmU [Deltaproteobacteria bacterium]